MQTWRLLAVLVCLLAAAPGPAEATARRRRWLVFPKGSSLQLVYCWLLSTYGTRDGIFVVNITVGLAWEIPQNLRRLLEMESKERLESRHRRQIYSKLSTLIDRLPELAEEEAERWDEELGEHRAYEAAAAESAAEGEDCESRYPCPLAIFHFK